MRRWFPLLAVLLLAAAGAQAGQCPNSGFSDPFGAVCGSVWKLTSANPYAYGDRPMTPYSVRICRTDIANYCFNGTTEYARDGYGTYGYEQFMINPPADFQATYWDLYAWNDAEHWGSSTIPIVHNFYKAPYGGYLGAYVSGNMPPAPLGSSPVYPDNGNLSVPSNGITVRWTRGIDAARDSRAWPVTYEIWFKHWDFGGSEPAYFSYSATLQCNADYTGNCSTYVTSLTPGHWRWYVKTDMDVTASLNVGPAVYKTDGPVATFDVP